MTLPNFLIIGAAKSGTTAMYHYLKQHPQIYMSPVKEPRFFSFAKKPPAFYGPGSDQIRNSSVVRLEDYEALFQGITQEKSFGEASVIYLNSFHLAETAENIRLHIPDVRLIAILRQPADRAYSNFTYTRQCGGEPATSFTQALAEEQARIHASWRPGFYYRLNGLYFANLKHYFERFRREQIRVYLYDDWLTNPHPVLKDIFGFLGVDDKFIPDTTRRYNETFTPRNTAIHTVLMKSYPVKSIFKFILPQSLRQVFKSGLISLNQTKPPLLDPELRRQLTQEYRDDILKLQDLIGRDLSHWLKI